MDERPRYAFSVAVVGDPDLMSARDIERLIAYLVNRKIDTHRVQLVTTGRGPELSTCQGRGWSVLFEPECGNPVKRDCALVAQCDALIVIGDPDPWARLLDLCRQARVPSRVYRTRPWLRSPRGYDPDPDCGDHT